MNGYWIERKYVSNSVIITVGAEGPCVHGQNVIVKTWLDKVMKEGLPATDDVIISFSASDICELKS